MEVLIRSAATAASRKSESGFALVMMIMLLAMLVIVVMGLAMETGIRDRMAFNLEQGTEALYIAEAGLHDTTWQLRQNSAWRTGFSDKAFGHGAYSVTLQDITTGFFQNTIRINAVGTIGTDLEREIEANVYAYPQAMNYALYAVDEIQTEGGTSLSIVGAQGADLGVPQISVDWAWFKQQAQDAGQYIYGNVDINGDTTITGIWYIDGRLRHRQGHLTCYGTIIVYDEDNLDNGDFQMHDSADYLTIVSDRGLPALIAYDSVKLERGTITLRGFSAAVTDDYNIHQDVDIVGTVFSGDLVKIKDNASGMIRYDPYMVPRHPAGVGQTSGDYDIAMAEGGWRQILD